MDVSLAKLRQLVTVAQMRSFSGAAVELNLSQPALSRSIASIEDRYGVKIFDRDHAGVKLTSSGAQIVDEAKVLLRDASTFDTNLRLYGRGERGQIAVGMAPLISSLILADLTKHVFIGRPGLRMRTLIRPVDALVEALLDNEIELLLGPGPLAMPAEVEIQVVGRISAAFLVRATHPLANVPNPAINDILRYPLACSVDIVWAANSRPLPGAFVCDNFHIMRDIVEDSDLVWICPQHFVCREIGKGVFTALSVKDSPLTAESPFAENDIVLGKLKGRTTSPIARRVMDFCEAYFAKTPHIR